MSPPQRMRAWGAGVSVGYAALGIAGAFLGVPSAELLFGLCAVVTLALALLIAPLLRPRPGDEGDGGSGVPRDPDEPPPWWPDFEGEFRDHVERLTSVRG